MGETLHITSGDCAGDLLTRAGVSGEVFVWHDLLYDGPRNPGWPDEATLDQRTIFLEQISGGGMERAFALQDQALLADLSQQTNAPLPWIPAAVTRWLQEQPDPTSGLGRLEHLILKALQSGCETPGEIFEATAKADTPPQYWGDITLWAKINGLAGRAPALLHINGPLKRLPQWESPVDLDRFRIKPTQSALSISR